MLAGSKVRDTLQDSIVHSKIVFVLHFLYFIFYPLQTQLITENEIILSRGGTHLGRLILCPLIKLYIMSKKNRYSIEIILRTAEQRYFLFVLFVCLPTEH